MSFPRKLNRDNPKFQEIMGLIKGKEKLFPYSIEIIDDNRTPSPKKAKYIQDYIYNAERLRQKEENESARRKGNKPFQFPRVKISRNGAVLTFKNRESTGFDFRVVEEKENHT